MNQVQVINYHSTLYLVGGYVNTQVFTLSADSGAEWQVLGEVQVSEQTRNIFPAPLLTSEMLPCVYKRINRLVRQLCAGKLCHCILQ